ncbi:neurexin-4 isoform X2 [Hyalella azteca]|uniref:Neurexin-4 isoform X2 n=1 Tax=Hyalella azteca TaxID=294128 RepID=A0A8B7NT63_HYAAZ|nr:neurexin-4 isoform X2 [Hyalella azteca]
MTFYIVFFMLILRTSAEWCEYPLIHESRLRASSELVTREANKAILYGPSAWSPNHNNYYQRLVVELPELMRVSKFATQGRQNSREFVSEFLLQYSTNGDSWISYKNAGGLEEAFRGNNDGNTVVVTRFETEIIARYLRINPTRWRDRISMRVEVYGCKYVRESISFRGQSMVEMNLQHAPIISNLDHMRFRLRTNQPDGVLLYGRGSQGDYLALQLVNNRLVLNINLGSQQMTSLSVGSLLDDNAWHDIEIRRNYNNISLLADRVRIDDVIVGDYPRLDLNRKFYIGGVPNREPGLVSRVNFTGCLENLFINGTSVVHQMKNPDPHAEYYGKPTYKLINTEFTCPYGESVDLTLTFKSPEAYLRYNSYEDFPSINVSLEFRTYEPKGLLIYHKFSEEGYFKLFLEDGHVKVEVMARQTPGKILLDNFQSSHNDGRWHYVELVIGKNKMLLVVDDVPMHTSRLIDIKSGKFFLIAGGVYGSVGFMGCLRKISVVGYHQKPKPEEIIQPEDVVVAACEILDRCNPNPCQHGASCYQDSEEFHCDCTGTGYSGAVCHVAMNPVSCAAYGKQNPHTKKADIYLDVDGSGPLEPFPVTCEFYNDDQTYTHLHHKQNQLTTVDGFSAAGSYVQDIQYDADFNQIEVLVNRSQNCRQRLHFECLTARLFNTPSNEDTQFRPSTWWVSRHNQPMDYWGGSLPGSRKCECGLTGNCMDATRWCNCDSGWDSWLFDSGDLTIKEHLPVRQLRIGDTGSPLDSKRARFKLGPLICDGDNVFDNVVTFRKADASINLPRYDMGHAGDIYFEFKTTTRDGCLIHARGPEDFIKVSIIGGLVLQFQYQAGAGPMAVTIETAYVLNDDTWHSVLVERNRKEARMIVDSGRKATVKEPPGPVRALYLTSDFVVGSTVDYRDGYVGCIRALILNGELQDLRGRAERGLYGVHGGCVGKCVSSPCLNNGTCYELYHSFACECRWTAFKGPICADEIGIKMLTDTMVKYQIPGSYMSTIAEKIRVGFTSTNPRGFLVGLYSNMTGEYLTLALSNSGHLRVTFDFGFERHEFVYEGRTFHEGQNHDVRLYRKDGGKTWVMEVDNYDPREWTFPVKESDDAQFNNIQYMYVGKNESMVEGFVGCISRVEFDDIYPLKFLFQQDGPDNIKAESTGKIFEDYCGIEPIRHPEEETETRPPPLLSEEVLMELYDDNSALLGGILVVLFLILIILGILIGRYIARHKGDYRTHEADGAELAPDADWAVQNSRTGHQVKRNTEMYI